MKQSDLVDNTATFAMIMSFSFAWWTRIAVGVILPNAYQTPPLPQKHINTRKCNLSLVQIIVDVYHLSGLGSMVPC